MKKIILFSLVTFLALNESIAQKTPQAIFFEIGGPGLASINYDTRFSKKETGLGGRIGIGGFKVDDESILTVPIGLTYLLGKDNKNYFEIGGGVTIVSAKDSYNDDTFTGTFGHLNFGYRMAPKNGGFFFRAAINPVFGQGDFIPLYGGIAFGYKF